MKNKMMLAFMLMLGVISMVKAQNVSTRTNEFEVDFSDPKKLVTSTVPSINWVTPLAETNYAQENRYSIKFEIESSTALKSISISIKETVEAASRGTQTILPKEEEKMHAIIERNLTLMDGENLLEIVAENTDGVKTISYKKVVVGSTTLADASKLNRTDYALIFATDQYDNWNDLVNPVFDSRTIAEE